MLAQILIRVTTKALSAHPRKGGSRESRPSGGRDMKYYMSEEGAVGPERETGRTRNS